MKALSEASEIINRKWSETRGPKRAWIFVVGSITLLTLLVVGTVWATGKALCAIAPKGIGADFYLPAKRNRSMYFPRRRR